MSDSPPDRLSANPGNPYYDEAALDAAEHGGSTQTQKMPKGQARRRAVYPARNAQAMPAWPR
jgi:hypothetical protein